MNKIKKVYKVLLIIIFLLALIINGLRIFFKWYALTPNGSYHIQALSVLLIFPLLIALLIAPLSLVAIIFKKIRECAFATFCCCIMYVFISLIIGRLGGNMRSREFFKLAIRAKPLIAAINTSTNDKGYPPENLGDLMPQYLPHIPKSGMGVYPNYTYKVAKSEKNWHGETNWYGNPG